jgi:predicted short-subunit dehydrogenase-like oxidoreductase (DUF2520 family)
MKIVFIGSGNVATHLAIAFKAMGADILQIWSKDSRNAELLAALTKAEPITKWEYLDLHADCYIIAVKDDAISEVSNHLSEVSGIVLHTAGAVSLDALNGSGRGHGVLYPLQTFSKSKSVDLKNVPFCIEGDRQETLEKISAIAHLLSANVTEVSSDQRKILHLAAVFACNFSNHLYHLSSELLNQHNLKFDLLKPLILETALKVQSAAPNEVQTGPAIRNDNETMQKHLALLADDPKMQLIYEMLSSSIIKSRQ